MLSHRPQILILDEATTGLDPGVREEILDILLDFIQDEEHSILFSTHITSDVEKVAQWFGYMNVQYARMAGIILLALFVNYMPKDKILIMWDFIQTPKLVVGSSLGVIVVAYIVSVIGYSRKK